MSDMDFIFSGLGLHQYFHKKDSTPIFDIEKKKFDYICKLESVSLNDSTLDCICRTKSGRQVPVRIDIYSPSIIRVRASNGSQVKAQETLMLVSEKKHENQISIKDTSDVIIAETEFGKLFVRKEPWGMRFADKREKTLAKEHADGVNKRINPVFPLGFAIDQIGQQSVFSSFDLLPDEHIYGLGEKFSDLDKRGRSILSWNSDAALSTSDRAYKNIPFFMSSRGYGIFINSSYQVSYEIGSHSHVSYSFEIQDSHLDYFFIYGPSFAKILEYYTELTGKAPVPPKWSFGFWMSRCGYKSRREVEEVAEEFRRREIPCDVIHIDPWWMKDGHFCDFEWNEEAFPNPSEMISRLKEKGFKVCLWEQPYVPLATEMYKEGQGKGFFVMDTDRNPYVIPALGSSQTAIVDFTNPEAVAWYKAKHHKLLEMGISVFKTDMGEAVPERSLFANGKTGYEMHNIYPLLYNRTVYEATSDHSKKNALVWGRSGYAGSQRYPVCWSGDPHCTFLDMACVLKGGLSLGMSGVPFWSHDIGGFQGTPTPELYIRWAQFGMLCSHSRCHGPAPREPWVYGAEVLRILKKYIQLKYRLLPYIYSMAHVSALTGLPMIRAMVLEYQDDPIAGCIDTQYMLGDSLLVAPVLDETNQRQIYLPEGKWLDFWKNTELRGPAHIIYDAPLDILPLFIRENSMVLMGPVMNYVGEKRDDPLEIRIFALNNKEIVYFDDDDKANVIIGKMENGKIFINLDIHAKRNALLNFTTHMALPGAVFLDGKKLLFHRAVKSFKESSMGWSMHKKNGLQVKLATHKPAVIEIQ